MTEATKFNHTLVGADKESVTLVADVLGRCSYARLKLISHLSVSEKAKLNH